MFFSGATGFSSHFAERFLIAFDYLFPVLLCVYPVRTWILWSRNEQKVVQPTWRGWVAVIGFGLSNISLLIVVATVVWGLVGSGRYADTPIAAGFILTLLTTSLLAIIAAIVGTGPLGIPTAVCAGFCVLMLMIHALAA